MAENTGYFNPEIENPQPSALPSFGQSSPNIGKRIFDLTSARTDERVPIGASNFLWAVSSSDDSAELEVKFNSPTSSGITFKKGMMIRTSGFKNLYITNSAQAGVTLTFHYGLEGKDFEIINPASSASSTTISGTVTVDKVDATGLVSTADNTLADATKTSVLALNANRKEAIITNIHVTSSIRVGDTDITATRGALLQAGQTIILATTAEIFCRNDSGGTVDVTLLEIED
jgi:hypothetical protein